MGWSSTNLLRHIKIASYWNRLINLKNDRPRKRLFLYSNSQFKNNWSSDFKSLCNSVRMSDKFNTLIEINVFPMNIKVNYDMKWK